MPKTKLRRRSDRINHSVKGVENMNKGFIFTIDAFYAMIFVALLAVLADLTGALGSGTGILLTVGIVYRLYEELAKEQLMESNVLMKKLMGG